MPSELSPEEAEEAGKLITGLGVAPKVLKETLSNVKLTREIVNIVKSSGFTAGCEKEQGALVMMVASTFPSAAMPHRPVLMEYVKDKRIVTNDQCSAAIKFFKTLNDGQFDAAKFEKACGVGIVVTDEEIAAAVSKALADNEAVIKEQRYHFNFLKLLQPIKATGDMAWADINHLKRELDKQSVAMLGPKTSEDEKPREKVKKVKSPKALKVDAATEKEAVESPKAQSPRSQDPFAFLPAPEENSGIHEEITLSDGSVLRFKNTQERLKAHLEATKGVVTRFPPEPNGYLHIGHAKAMFIDFGLAKKRGGKCLLRFDDTNPEAESIEYIEHIKEVVKWMGWDYSQITYSSDYFDELHAFAVKLIMAGKAYVCHQTGEEIKEAREQRLPSPWRERPMEESMRLFEDMRRGLIDEKAATLRLKMDPRNDNRNMDDLVAYRVKFCAHPHVGDKWCIYPSYDFTHCIVDALENITHSLCTLEFHGRRPSYYWLLQELGLYMPVVWEYSRLNITQHVMSKRKLQAMVSNKLVRGWDDPRMPTLAGMRRRGLTPEGINSLCHELGINRSEGFVQLKRLYHHVRNHLDATSPRTLAVLRPLKLVIDNVEDSYFEEVKALKFPGRSEESYVVPFTKVCYIEATDFRETDSKDYYGLAPGKSVMLRYASVVSFVSYEKDERGKVSVVHVRKEANTGKPPKGVLNWIGQTAPGKDPPTAEARLYADSLFNSDNPGEKEDWLGDLSKDTEEVLTGVMISAQLKEVKTLDKFQFERLGYFCVDKDSTPSSLVFNRTCTLRDSYSDKR